MCKFFKKLSKSKGNSLSNAELEALEYAERDLILDKFKFLEQAEFVCEVVRPSGFISVHYKHRDIYIGIGTDYREDINYLTVVINTGKTVGTTHHEGKEIQVHEIKRIYEFSIGTQEERNKLKALENTEDNFPNVLEAYAEFIKNNLDDIKRLAT